MNKQTKRTAEAASTPKLAELGVKPSDQSAAPTRQRTATAKRKTAHPAKGREGSQPNSRRGIASDKLLCRYCGSEDLAPSFKKRRDARCRACFKQRYRAVSREREGARTQKRELAAK